MSWNLSFPESSVNIVMAIWGQSEVYFSCTYVSAGDISKVPVISTEIHGHYFPDSVKFLSVVGVKVSIYNISMFCIFSSKRLAVKMPTKQQNSTIFVWIFAI